MCTWPPTTCMLCWAFAFLEHLWLQRRLHMEANKPRQCNRVHLTRHLLALPLAWCSCLSRILLTWHNSSIVMSTVDWKRVLYDNGNGALATVSFEKSTSPWAVLCAALALGLCSRTRFRGYVTTGSNGCRCWLFWYVVPLFFAGLALTDDGQLVNWRLTRWPSSENAGLKRIRSFWWRNSLDTETLYATGWCSAIFAVRNWRCGIMNALTEHQSTDMISEVSNQKYAQNQRNEQLINGIAQSSYDTDGTQRGNVKCAGDWWSNNDCQGRANWTVIRPNLMTLNRRPSDRRS